MMTVPILTQPIAGAQVKRCTRCHRPIRSAQSLEVGLGPSCAEILGIPYPTKPPADACRKCNGKGMITELDSTGDVVPTTCPACGGNRKIVPEGPDSARYVDGGNTDSLDGSPTF